MTYVGKNHGEQRFFQFEIIINFFVGSSRFFRIAILTILKSIPALKGLTQNSLEKVTVTLYNAARSIVY